jgi:ABC-type dipeptide/oligopeptide/nickel transport system ATPase subunit
VLQDISFTLKPGESLAVVGSSGSGKTTLARSIAGLIPSAGGTVRVNGVPIERARRPSGASEVQLLFQNHSASIDPRSTVREVLQEGLEATRKHPGGMAYAELLSSVGLADLSLSRRTADLSGGERQRIALARLLAAEPRVLIADEPTSALDRLTGDGVLDVLQSTCQRRGIALIHVTHDLQAARRTTPRAVILHEGTVVDDGTWKELIRSPRHPITRTLLNAAGLS